jgi:cell wall-associated NlpC family hydrolase
MVIAGAATAQSSYTVRQGDTIEGIARRLGIAQSAILAANPGVRPERMQIGQRLRLPATEARATSPAPSRAAAQRWHTVRSGENDWTISRRYGLTTQQLHRLNPNVDFSPLQIGVRLNVSGGASAPVRAAPVRAAAAPAAVPRAGGTYIVRAGDNDWDLARRFGITMRQLHAMNPNVDFSPLQIGVRLRVPGGSAQAAPARIATRNARVAATAAVVRRTPSTTGARVTTVHRGVIGRVLDRDGQWYRLRFAGGGTGWVRGDLLAATSASLPVVASAAASRTARPQAPARRPAAVAPSPQGDLAVLSRARQYMGVRYRFGGTSRSGFDCSGFVQHVFRTQGVRLPRTSLQQSRVGTPVSRENLRKGDLVFFRTRGNRISHVGIYQGGGRFIHSSSGGGGVEVDSMRSGFYDRRFAGARRVLANPRPAPAPAPPRSRPAEAAKMDAPPVRREDPPSRAQVGADEIQR